MTLVLSGCLCGDNYLNYKIHLHTCAAKYDQNKVWGENQTIVQDAKIHHKIFEAVFSTIS